MTAPERDPVLPILPEVALAPSTLPEDALAQHAGDEEKHQVEPPESQTAPKHDDDEGPKHRVDGGLEAWMSVVLAAMINFVGLGTTYAFGVFEAQYLLVDFPHSSPTVVSFIGAVNIAIALSFGVFVGRAAEIYGHRLIASIGSLFFVVSLIGASFAPTISVMVACQGVLNGLAQACLFVPSNALPAPYFDKKLSLAMGLVSAGSGVGGIAWSFIVRRLITQVGTWWTLRIVALMGFALLLPGLFMIRTPKAKQAAIKAGSFRDTLKLFKVPRFYLFYICSALTATGYNIPFFYIATYVETRCGASKTVGANVSACMSVGLLLGRCTLGFIADSKIGRMNTVIFAMTMAGIVQLLVWGIPQGNLSAAYAFSVLYGYFGGGYIGLMPLILAHIFDPNKLASITGIFFTSELPGQLAGAPIAGAILTASGGNYVYAILFSGLLQVVGSVFGVATRFVVEKKVVATI